MLGQARLSQDLAPAYGAAPRGAFSRRLADIFWRAPLVAPRRAGALGPRRAHARLSGVRLLHSPWSLGGPWTRTFDPRLPKPARPPPAVEIVPDPSHRLCLEAKPAAAGGAPRPRFSAATLALRSGSPLRAQSLSLRLDRRAASARRLAPSCATPAGIGGSTQQLGCGAQARSHSSPMSVCSCCHLIGSIPGVRDTNLVPHSTWTVASKVPPHIRRAE